jgi:uncharacterized protein YkwD
MGQIHRSIVRSVMLVAIASLCGCGAGKDDDPTSGADAGVGGHEPSATYCAPVASWPGAWVGLEDEVLALVNRARGEGASCGSRGTFGPAAPLAMDGALRCAAQMHSRDMHERDFFDHRNPDGQEPWDRMKLAGYDWRRAGENIAAGSSTAEKVMSQWMSSAGHCANIMSSDFVHLGAGFQGDGHLWTLVLGRP